MGALFEVIETSEYVCPKCGSALEKVTRPVNVQVFACTNDDCEMEYGEGYLTGWHDATVAMLASRPTPRAADLPSAPVGCRCFVAIESYNACPVRGTANR